VFLRCQGGLYLKENVVHALRNIMLLTCITDLSQPQLVDKDHTTTYQTSCPKSWKGDADVAAKVEEQE
jgi:hypothetical protein